MNLQQALALEQYAVEQSAIPNGDLFCTLKLVTEVTMNKNARGTAKGSGNPFTGRLLKHCIIRGDVFVGPRMYEDRVRARRRKEGVADPDSFTAKKPSGRHHIEGTNAVTQGDRNPDQHYLSLYFPKFEARKPRVESWYELDGIPIRLTPTCDIAAYLPSDFFKPKVEGAGQGLSHPVVTRTPKLESVVALKCGRVLVGEMPDDSRLQAAFVEVEDGEEVPTPG